MGIPHKLAHMTKIVMEVESVSSLPRPQFSVLQMKICDEKDEKHQMMKNIIPQTSSMLLEGLDLETDSQSAEDS